MIIDIPKHTPNNVPVKTIGIWMSGGADSALLCYLLAEKIKKENLNITIQPITIDYKRPFAFKAGPVREKIEEILDATSIFENHIVYNPPGETIWSPEELAKQFHIRNYEHFKDNRFQVLYSGITTNPPVEIQKTFKNDIHNVLQNECKNIIDEFKNIASINKYLNI
jgi:3'-phosphoadenosine 5'-phosphosulfate sulfotransferase (PAPS reductase)/FAD synthetase